MLTTASTNGDTPPPLHETQDGGVHQSTTWPQPTAVENERNCSFSWVVDSLPAPPPNHCRKRAIMLVFDSSCRPYHNHHTSTLAFQPQNHHYKRPKPQIRAFVLDFGVSAPSSCKFYYIYYIIFNLIYQTRQTRGCRCGLGTGDSKSTCTRTRATHTWIPARVYKPMTGPTPVKLQLYTMYPN